MAKSVLLNVPSLYGACARRKLEATPANGTHSDWRLRMRQIAACPDSAKLDYAADAGEIRRGLQVMHSGIKVPLGSYYGLATTAVFKETRGVHEPQEERLFAQFLKNLDKANPVMVELGAYWAFYSAWFGSAFAHPRNIMVEPIEEYIRFGKETFALNGLQGEFLQAFVGESYKDGDDLPEVSVPWLMEQFKIEELDLLHSDIQGFEVPMLRGAAELLAKRRIRALFVSTHSDEIHQQCKDMLVAAQYVIGADINQADSYAADGLIVATRPGDEALMRGFEYSRRSQDPSEAVRLCWR